MRTITSLVSLLLCTVVLGNGQVRTLEAGKGSSVVTYRISHPLHKIEATSNEVLYKVIIDTLKKEIERVSADVDVTTFNSGNSNRDSHAMEVIDAITYPDASFTSTEIRQSGDTLSVNGALTFHGVTKPIIASGSSQWLPDTLHVEAGFTISMTEFGVERPSLLLIPVSDTIRFTLQAAFGLK